MTLWTMTIKNPALRSHSYGLLKSVLEQGVVEEWTGPRGLKTLLYKTQAGYRVETDVVTDHDILYDAQQTASYYRRKTKA